MFTGIVQGTAQISAITKLENLNRINVQFPPNALINLKRGASIAINGTCLTVTEFDNQSASFDVMAETLRLTNLNSLITGDEVNFERAAKFGDEIGGHILSGHIHTTAKVKDIKKTNNLFTLTVEIDNKWLKYILPKGFVALNGASLTVGENVENGTFSVHLIPETISVTTFSTAKPGDVINIEIDSQTQTIVSTLENLGLNFSQIKKQ